MYTGNNNNKIINIYYTISNECRLVDTVTDTNSCGTAVNTVSDI